MKTKTLLVAAATLAAGALASQAQVYSQNVVGYYNITVQGSGYTIVANQLINGTDANATNNAIGQVFTGLSSDVNGITNTVIYLWNGAQYTAYQYYTGSDAYNYFLLNSVGTNGFYDASGNYITSSLPQGIGAFLYNPNAGAITATVVGTVAQQTNLLTITPGFNLLSLPDPISTNIESSLGGFVGTSDPNGINNDVLYKWNGSQYSAYQYFTGTDAYNYFLLNSVGTNGFYDASGNYISSAVSVGSAFFLDHVVSGNEYWTNSFTVQ
jgi:hypothetical protein